MLGVPFLRGKEVFGSNDTGGMWGLAVSGSLIPRKLTQSVGTKATANRARNRRCRNLERCHRHAREVLESATKAGLTIYDDWK